MIFTLRIMSTNLTIIIIAFLINLSAFYFFFFKTTSARDTTSDTQLYQIQKEIHIDGSNKITNQHISSSTSFRLPKPEQIQISTITTSSSSSSSSSILLPNWQENILKASASVSFKRFSACDASFRSSSCPSFWYSVEETLHSADYIVSQETATLQFWNSIIQNERTKKQPCIVLDVGSNGGYFSLMSRAHGCKVLAVDAQPWCLTRLSSSAAINGFDTNFQVKWAAVSDNKDLTFEVGATKCSGLWEASKESGWINAESSIQTKVSSIPCNNLVEDWLGNNSEEVISLFKIDAEGSELNILKSALPLLRKHRIRNIVAEIVPARVNKMTTWDDVKATLSEIKRNGYLIHKLDDGGSALIEGGSSSDSSAVLESILNPSSTAQMRGAPAMWRISLKS